MSLLECYPLFSRYIFVMTVLVMGAVAFHFWGSAQLIAVCFTSTRLVNLLMLVVVSRGEVYRYNYGPKRSLPHWVWRQAQVLMFLSFLTALVITAASIYSSGVSESWMETSINFVARFLWIALISLAIYAGKVGMASQPSRARMIAFGLIFYASAELLWSFVPATWRVGTLLSAAYVVTLLVWIAALLLPRYRPPPPSHPDVLKEFLDLASVHFKEARDFLDREEMRQR